MAYAEKTKVPIGQTKGEIESLVLRHGGTTFGILSGEDMAQVVFEEHGRRLLFRLPLIPEAQSSDKQREQFRRARWRALLLAIKAKFESIEGGIETFEEAFLANIVLPDGKTVAEHARPAIASSYDSGEMRPLLPAPKKGDS